MLNWDDAPQGHATCGARRNPDPQKIDFESRLRAQVEQRMAATPAMLHCIDEAGLLVFVSDAWLDKLGYRREEALGRPATDFMTEDSRRRALRELIPEFFRMGRCDNHQFQMVKRNGDVIEVLLSAVVVDDGAGRGRLSLSVITDITALVEAKRFLDASEARYRGLVEDQSELVSLSTPQGELRYVNAAYATFLGRRPEDMVGRSLFDFIPQDERAHVAEHLARVCARRAKVECENRVIQPDGNTRWFAWTNRALTDPEGPIAVIHSVGRDIQDRVEAERRLKASEARYRFLAENSTDMILLVDANGNRIYASPASRKLLGFEPEETVGLRLQDSIHPDDAPRVLPVLADRPGETLLTYRMRRKNGSYVWVETTGKTVDIAGGERQRLIIVRDVSARKAVEDRLAEANAKLALLSSQDGLTGLANRRIFDETLARECRRAARAETAIALIMIDVDRFKGFNDLNGHPAGDKCLRCIAGAIAESVRRPADVAARYGGEEFAVVLPGTDEAGAMTVAANIQRAVQHLQIKHGSSEWGIATVSIGVAAARPTAAEYAPDLLLRDADRALYAAKNDGRNAVRPASGLRGCDGHAQAAI